MVDEEVGAVEVVMGGDHGRRKKCKEQSARESVRDSGEDSGAHGYLANNRSRACRFTMEHVPVGMVTWAGRTRGFAFA